VKGGRKRMRTNASENWHKKVLEAREHFLNGLLKPDRRFKITKADLERSRERRMAQVIQLAERRFRR